MKKVDLLFGGRLTK